MSTHSCLQCIDPGSCNRADLRMARVNRGTKCIYISAISVVLSSIQWSQYNSSTNLPNSTATLILDGAGSYVDGSTSEEESSGQQCLDPAQPGSNKTSRSWEC